MSESVTYPGISEEHLSWYKDNVDWRRQQVGSFQGEELFDFVYGDIA